MPGDDAIQAPVFVGYNLRFHPLAQRLQTLLGERAIVSAEIHVGQHLADWRPGRDHRASYSGDAEAGGGVLRDLSHELDLALWLFGKLRRVSAIAGRSGALGTNAEDHALLLASFARCPACSIALNCLDRPARRAVHVVTTAGNATLDFIAGTFSVDGETVERAALDRDATYRAQHEALLSGAPSPLCTYEEGLAALRFVEAAERANLARTWIEAA